MIFRASLMFVCVLLTGAVMAQSCRPQLTLEPPVADQWQLEQLANGQNVRIPFRIEVSANRSSCPFLVGFDLVHSGQITAQVELRPFSQPLVDISAADPRRILSGITSDDTNTAFDLDLVIIPKPGLRARRLNIQLTQRLYAGSDPANAVQTERVRHRVALDIPASARLIVDSDIGERELGTGPGFLALGELVSGINRSAGLRLEGNTAVTVDVRAVNAALQHTRQPAYTVPYTYQLNGRTGQATSGVQLRMEPGQRVDLSVQVGEIERLIAGEYQDTLRITISVD